MNESDGIRENPYKGIDNVMCKAFKAARDANPDALLFYNDYNMESTEGWMKAKSDFVFEMISDMKD